jgi:hypothetical protein
VGARHILKTLDEGDPASVERGIQLSHLRQKATQRYFRGNVNEQDWRIQGEIPDRKWRLLYFFGVESTTLITRSARGGGRGGGRGQAVSMNWGVWCAYRWSERALPSPFYERRVDM